MREIKFRAWDKEGIHRDYDNAGKAGMLEDVIGKTYWDAIIYDKDFILMQFTGLKDKNGKEIYEGDIVKCIRRAWMDSGSCGHARFSNIGIVRYNNSFGWFEVTRHGGGKPDFGLFVVDKMHDGDPPETNEVLGNIHENSELLKEVQKK